MFMIILFHSKIWNHPFPGKISMFTVVKVRKQRSKMRLWAIIFLNVLPKKNLLSYFFCRAQTLDHPEHKLLRKDFQKWDAQCWTQKCFPKSWKSIFLKFRNIFSFFFNQKQHQAWQISGVFRQSSQVHDMTLGDGSVQRQELNLMILELEGPFQISLFCDSVSLCKQKM